MKKIILLLFCFSIFLLADAYQRAAHFYTIDNNVGLEYFDPITFFEGDPKLGDENIPFANNGINYLFVSWENQKKYAENRDKYEAQYGGWDAYEMSQERSKVQPDIYIYRVIEDKLYFFASEKNAEKFEANYDELSLKAQENWDLIYGIKIDMQDFDVRNDIY
jgi:hypothetical protein